MYVLRSLLRSNLRNLSKSLPAQLNQSLAMVLMCIILLAGGKISEGGLALCACSIRPTREGGGAGAWEGGLPLCACSLRHAQSICPSDTLLTSCW